MMRIDPSKLNMSERDLEDYLWANPHAVTCPYHGGKRYVDRWLARQLPVPSGIIDLFGICNLGMPVVVELKIGPIDAKALAQVARYAQDIGSLFAFRYQSEQRIEKIAIGASCETQAMFEAGAMDVSVILFSAKVEIDFSAIYFTHDYSARTEQTLAALSKREDLLSPFDPLYSEERQAKLEQSRKEADWADLTEGGA